MNDARQGYPYRLVTPRQRDLLQAQLGYDDGGRYALVAVTGYAVSDDAFGTVFSIIDCDTGDEVSQTTVTRTQDTRVVRREQIGLVRHMNGREDPYGWTE